MKKITFNISGLTRFLQNFGGSGSRRARGSKKNHRHLYQGRAGVQYDENKIDLDQIFSKIKSWSYTPELLDITANGPKKSISAGLRREFSSWFSRSATS